MDLLYLSFKRKKQTLYSAFDFFFLTGCFSCTAGFVKKNESKHCLSGVVVVMVYVTHIISRLILVQFGVT